MTRQPKAVWAVAFACVVAFMGIGLVDPILPAIATQLDASPSQVELLFTSYFAVTGAAMLVTGFVSSRIGPKRTMLAGLALVVIFSALAGASGSVGEIVGFRAGWGLGNALFIATALSVIIGAASGGVSGAIILYEAALGLGIASGPLLGGLLGGISWRGPFFGTAALMAIGFVAIVVLLDTTPRPARKTSLLDPLRALRHRGDPPHGADRALLQLRLLHAARLHAVPAAHGRARARPRLLRLGPRARAQLGAAGAGCSSTASARAARSAPRWPASPRSWSRWQPARAPRRSWSSA